MNETPLSLQVLKLVQQRPGITDSEITSAVGKGVLHQQINQVCRRLRDRGELIRNNRPDGLIGNHLSGSHLGEAQSKKVKRPQQNSWSNTVQEGIPMELSAKNSKETLNKAEFEKAPSWLPTRRILPPFFRPAIRLGSRFVFAI